MRNLLISLSLIFVANVLIAQNDPVLTCIEQQRLMNEYDITRMLKIDMKHTYLLETSDGEITGRKALISEQYYSPDGTPLQLIYFDSIGNRAQYSLFRFDNRRFKTEEIYFEADSSMRGGFAAEYDSLGFTSAQYYYNPKAEIVSKQVFSYDHNKNIVLARLYNSAGNLSSHRTYRFEEGIKDGRLISVATTTADHQAIDSIAFLHNIEGQVSEKLFFDANAVLLQKIEYYYNDSGAVIKSIETNRITRQVRVLSYTYDEYENTRSIIENLDNEIINCYKFEYFSKKDDNK